MAYPPKGKEAQKLLGARALDQILADSPYEFGHFQGEDGYRIFDERSDEAFVGFAATPLRTVRDLRAPSLFRRVV